MTTQSTENGAEAVTAQLAMFVERLRWQDLPPKVVAKTTLHILDGLGCVAVGSLLPWINQIQAYANDTGKPGTATVVGGSRLVPEWAAFANATAAHGFELDDYHSGALAHPGCVVVPTALAVGEALGSSGQDIVLACALGMEAIVRIGLAVSPSMVVDRGFHETCTQGVFGASVAASKLMGLKSDIVVSALGLAGSHASGTRQYSHSGGEVKRLHAGLGASGGIRSAYLASRGFQGPPAILEGSRGFMQAFANEYDPALVTTGLGESWQFTDCGIKPHASCGLIHAPTDALVALLSEHKIAAKDIAEVVVGTDRLSLEHVGSLPLLPQDMNGAQFNLPYSLGMVLAERGSGFSSYWQLHKSAYGDPTILEFAKRIRMVLDPEVEASFPRVLSSRVRIRTVDGKWVERMSIPVGSKESPLSQSAVKAKFIDLLSQTRWAPKAGDLADKIQELQINRGRASVMEYFSP